jgi:hypothetical protein
MDCLLQLVGHDPSLEILAALIATISAGIVDS